MSGRLPLFAALLVALFVGVVPLRVCLAQGTGGLGVVAIGAHSHGDHDGTHDNHVGVPSGDRGADHDEEACCVDSPFHAVASVDMVSADRSIDPSLTSLPLLVPDRASPGVSAPAKAKAPAPSEVREPVPMGLVSTVLLR